MFIEKLVNHLFDTSAAIEDRQITRVIIQSKALPIIFSSKENDSMLDKIKQALQQSFITTTHCSFNAFDK